MSLQRARFQLDEQVALSGQPMRVAGLVQYEEPGPKIITRYLLAPAAGSRVIVEDDGKQLIVLRPFPPTKLPEAAGDTVSVMGAHYRLCGVRKLKVLGAAGEAPGGAPAGPLLLSGQFEGEMGALMREMTPGKEGQAFYALKTLQTGEVLGAAQLAEQASKARQVARQEAAVRAAAEEHAPPDDDDEEEGGGLLQKLGSWVVTALIIMGLAWACASPDEESDDGSARSSSIRITTGGK